MQVKHLTMSCHGILIYQPLFHPHLTSPHPTSLAIATWCRLRTSRCYRKISSVIWQANQLHCSSQLGKNHYNEPGEDKTRQRPPPNDSRGPCDAGTARCHDSTAFFWSFFICCTWHSVKHYRWYYIHIYSLFPMIIYYLLFLKPKVHLAISLFLRSLKGNTSAQRKLPEIKHSDGVRS